MLPTYIKYILIGSHLPILVVCAYTVFIFRSLPRLFKVFSIFIFFSGLIQFPGLILALLKQNNHPLLHIYVPLGCVLLIWFYKHILEGFANKNVFIFSGILFLVYSLINTLCFQKITSYNSNALTVESVIIIILSISTYGFLLNTIVRKDQSLISSLNWINSGIFIYYTSSLLLFYFGSKILSISFPREYSLYIWVLHAFFSVIMYVCFFIGLWKRPKILAS